MVVGYLLGEPHLPGLLSSSLNIGGIDTAVGWRTNASGTNAEHQALVYNIAVQAGIVTLQMLGSDGVSVGDAFAGVLL